MAKDVEPFRIVRIRVDDESARRRSRYGKHCRYKLGRVAAEKCRDVL